MAMATSIQRLRISVRLDRGLEVMQIYRHPIYRSQLDGGLHTFDRIHLVSNSYRFWLNAENRKTSCSRSFLLRAPAIENSRFRASHQMSKACRFQGLIPDPAGAFLFSCVVVTWKAIGHRKLAWFSRRAGSNCSVPASTTEDPCQRGK